MDISPIAGLSPMDADYGDEVEQAPCTETAAESDIEIEQDPRKSYMAHGSRVGTL